jgi:hypothetical protein
LRTGRRGGGDPFAAVRWRSCIDFRSDRDRRRRRDGSAGGGSYPRLGSSLGAGEGSIRDRACFRRVASAYGERSKSPESSRFPFSFGVRPRSVNAFDLSVSSRVRAAYQLITKGLKPQTAFPFDVELAHILNQRGEDGGIDGTFVR